MNDFLLSHTSFAVWGILFLVGGAVTTLAWAACFKRLAKTEIQPNELRWEAWRGVLGAGFWVASMLLILLLMISTNDINSAEAIAATESASPLLVESIKAGSDLIIIPVLCTFALILGILFLAGLWSGSLKALRYSVKTVTQLNKTGLGEQNG